MDDKEKDNAWLAWYSSNPFMTDREFLEGPPTREEDTNQPTSPQTGTTPRGKGKGA